MRKKRDVWLAVVGGLLLVAVALFAAAIAKNQPWTQPLMIAAYALASGAVVIVLALLLAREREGSPRIVSASTDTWRIDRQTASGFIEQDLTTPVSFGIVNVGDRAAHIDKVMVITSLLDAADPIAWNDVTFPPILQPAQAGSCAVYIGFAYDVLSNTRFHVTVDYHAENGGKAATSFTAEWLGGESWKLSEQLPVSTTSAA